MKPYLQKYKGPSTRHTCPNCGVKKSFALYLNGDTHEPIHPTVGICNRQNKCGYHYPPRMYYADNPNFKNDFTPDYKPYNAPDFDTPVNYIPFGYVTKSKSNKNHFIDFLKTLFNSVDIQKVADDYLLGSTRNNEIIFWQIDTTRKVRTGKIMQYNPVTGKRIKHEDGAINWVHNKLKRQGTISQDFNLSQCLFGEHLLKTYPNKTVSIVESEKTAIIASIVFPDYVWLATGALNGLSLDKCFVLDKRKVYIFPDLGKAYEIWKQKSEEISNFIIWNVHVSGLLENIATPSAKAEGFDIADYIISQLRSNQQSAAPVNPKNQIRITPDLQSLIERYPSVISLIDKLELVEV